MFVPRRRHPLGLPPGSVRGLLSLMIVSAVIVETIRGRALDLLLAESLMIVLALYFTARRVVSLPPDVLRQLEEAGQLPSERHPLYLPRFSIRAVILLSFLSAAGYLYQQGRLFTSEAFSSIGLVLAYFVGVMVRAAGSAAERWNIPRGLLDWLADSRALLVLGSTATLTIAYWADRVELLPTWAPSLMLSLLLFYFGAR